MISRNKSALVALALATALGVTACGSKNPSNNTTQSGPKTLTFGMTSSPETFNSITNKTSYGARVLELLYPTLLTFTDKLTFAPNLAETYDVNADNTVWTFHLRKDAKWSDGKPITAEDVRYFYGVIAHPDTPTTRRSLMDTIKGLDAKGVSLTKDTNIEGIRAIDANTLQITTKGPVEKDKFLEQTIAGVNIMPKHVLETVKNLKELDKADFNLKPTVFGGPYKLVEYKTDSHVELAPNETFYKGKPKLDKLFVKILTGSAIPAALQTGELDMTGGAGVGEVPIADWEKISKLPNMTPQTYVAQSYQLMNFNLQKPELKDARVRRAFAFAINRDQIVSRLLKGQGEVLNTPLNSANKYYVKDLQADLKYDPVKAKQLLQEAGWDFNKEVTVLTPSGNGVREQSAELIMANLKDVGVKVQIEKVDLATRTARAKAGDFQLDLIGFSASFDPDMSAQLGTGSAFNYSVYANPQMDQLLDKGKLTVKFEDRMKVYRDAQELFIKDLPLLPLYVIKSLNVVNNRVVNVKMGPNGITWNAEEWDVK